MFQHAQALVDIRLLACHANDVERSKQRVQLSLSAVLKTVIYAHHTDNIFRYFSVGEILGISP